MGFKQYDVFAKGVSREDLWERLLLEPSAKPERVLMLEEFRATWGDDLSSLDPNILADFRQRYFSAPLTTASGEKVVCGYVLLSGWYHVSLNMYSTNIFRDEALLPRLSKAGEIIFCSLHEGVNCSSSSFWKNGEENWHIEHDACNNPPEHLSSRGITPETFPDVLEQINQKHRDQERQKREAGPEMRRDIFFGNVDYYFDVPLLVVELLTGWRYSRALPIDKNTEPDYLKFRSDHPVRF